MKTELEKQFYQCFGIEPKYKTCIFKYCKYKNEYDCENCNDREWHYPQITDTHYLELITHLSGVTKPYFVFERGITELKQDILIQCMYYAELLKPFVQRMFYDN